MAAPGEKLFCVLEYHTSKTVVTVQRAFCAKYAKDACVARTWISYRCVPCHPWCTHRTSL